MPFVGLFVLYSHNHDQLYKHITHIHLHMHAEHNDTIKTSDTVLRKIYLSLYLKGCVWEGVGDRTELQYIDPHSIGYNRVSFPFSWAVQPEAWGPSLSGCWFSLPHLVTNWSGLQIADFLSSPSYIIVQRPPSCWRHNRTHSIRSRSRLYSDIPWADAPVIYTGEFPILTAWPGRRSIYNIWKQMIWR